jgi:DNA-nicking Smr family endonuclease
VVKFRKPPELFQLIDQDCEDWQQYSRNVKPLEKLNRVVKKKARRIKISVDHNTSIDEFTCVLKPSSSKQSKKQIRFQACLDLHGMTRDQAYEKLVYFIAQSQAQNFKCVLVITGKGRPHTKLWWENLGILKDLVPRWLMEEPNHARVASYQYARPQDGGEGALYIFLNALK